MISKTVPLFGDPPPGFDGKWQSPDSDGLTIWTFQRITLISAFETRNVVSHGVVIQVLFGGEPQLVRQVPSELILTMGPIALTFPILEIGELLAVSTRGFKGEIRPIGKQMINAIMIGDDS